MLGRRLDDEIAGATAAVLLACSPIFLYQDVPPMSDVPATALWLVVASACIRTMIAARLPPGSPRRSPS